MNFSFFPRRYAALLVALVALLVADVITTTYGLAHGGIEGNPAMIWIVSNPWVHLGVKMAFAGLVAGMALRCDTLKSGSGVYCLTAACGFYLLPLINNLHQIGIIG